MSPYSVSLLLILLVGWGCVDDANLIREVQRNKGNEEIVSDVTLYYTDSGKLQVLLRAPVIVRKKENNAVIQEFTDGIYCEFYDDSSRLKARLTARYAIRNEDKQIMTARDRVVLVSADSTRLETEELIWDENRRLVYSNKFFKWTRNQEIGTGFFFEADQSFKKIKMRNTEADNIVVPGLKPN